MPTPSLPISRLINVAVNLSPAAVQAPNTSTLLILGSSTVIDVVTRMRSYTTITQVATDFGTSAPEYLAAVLWFEQAPQPTTLLIGRWAQVASSGQLFGATLTPAHTLISFWTGITNGGVDFVVDGVAKNLTGLNFSAVTNLNGVASTIGAALTGATIVYNSVFNRFEVTSNTTGTSSTVAFATAGAGTDISGSLGLTTASSGAYVANGILAESALAAVTLFDNQFGQQWFGLTIASTAVVDNDHVAVAGFIEAATNYHYYGVSTQEAGVLSSTSTTDIASVLQVLKYNRTAIQYNGSSPYSVASLLGRILTVDYTGNNTVIDLFYKQEPGIIPDTLNTTQINVLESKNANAFVTYNNNTAIIEPGNSVSGLPIDEVIGAMVFAIDLQNAIFNLLFTSSTKIPQTDQGIHQIVTTVESICSQFVNNGFLAPGIWNFQGFGALTQGQFMSKGFYVFAPPVATQSLAARQARQSPLIQVAVKLAGAVRNVNLLVTVNP